MFKYSIMTFLYFLILVNTSFCNPHYVEERSYKQCGINCIYFLLKCLGRDTTFSDIASQVDDSIYSEGMTVRQLQNILDSFCVPNEHFIGSIDLLDKAINNGGYCILPADNKKHFYVITSKEKTQYQCYDPPGFLESKSRNELKKLYSGHFIVISDSSSYELLDQYKRKRDYFKFFIGVCVITLSMVLLGLSGKYKRKKTV